MGGREKYVENQFDTINLPLIKMIRPELRLTIFIKKKNVIYVVTFEIDIIHFF